MELTTILAIFGFGMMGLLITGGVILGLMTVMGMILAFLFYKTRKIVIPRVTLFILNLFEVPIRYALWIFGMEQDILSTMIVEIRNRIFQENYRNTPYNKRVIFLPQCLRSPDCPAPLTPEGINCLNCGKCGIGQIKDEAESKGYKFFICPGSSLIKRMLKKYTPSAVIGVGCPMEVKEGTDKMAAYGLPVQGVILERDGCVDTRVDVLELLRTILNEKNQVIDEDELIVKSEKISSKWIESEVNIEIIPKDRGRYKI